jgi:hypothetical protein
MTETTTEPNSDGKKAVAEAFDNGRVEVGFNPASLGNYDVEDFNRIYAVVQLGGQTLVLQENFLEFPEDQQHLIPPADRVRFMSVESFKTWMLNRQMPTEEGKFVAMSGVWLRDPGRRQFRGVVFDPVSAPGESDYNYYNLWRGWTVEPDPGGDCSLFLDHVKTNLAAGNEEHARYIMAWAAQMVQEPASKPGISLVLRGGMGTGKTIFGQVLGRLMGPHYVLVDDPHYVTGNFNSHMAACLLLQADEGFWAGDPGAAGRLKGLVTSTHQMIEPKGKDAVQMANHVRLLVTSNSEWVVPAGPDERRFAVFDVGDASAQNREYFGDMLRQMEQDGGYGRLLHELLEFDLSSVDLNRLPETDALVDQKIASLSPVDKWWYECLRRGWIRPFSEATEMEWPSYIPTGVVYASYLSFAEKIRLRFCQTDAQVGRALQKIAPGIQRCRRRDGTRREYVYRIPSLDACRAAFAEHIRANRIDWQDDEIDVDGPGVPGSSGGVDDL